MISQENLLHGRWELKTGLLKLLVMLVVDAEFYFVDHLFIAHPLYRNLSDENATCGTR